MDKEIKDLMESYIKVRSTMEQIETLMEESELSYADIIEGLYLSMINEYMYAEDDYPDIATIVEKLDKLGFIAFKAITNKSSDSSEIVLSLLHAMVQYIRSIQEAEIDEEEEEEEIVIKITKDKNGRTSSNIIDFGSILDDIIKKRDR